MVVDFAPSTTPEQKAAIMAVINTSVFSFDRLKGLVIFEVTRDPEKIPFNAAGLTQYEGRGDFTIYLHPDRNGVTPPTIMHELGHCLSQQMPANGVARFSALVGADPNNWVMPDYNVGKMETWAASVSETWAETFMGIFLPSGRRVNNKTIYTLPRANYEAYLDLIEQCCSNDEGGGGGGGAGSGGSGGGTISHGEDDDGTTDHGGGVDPPGVGELVMTSTAEAGTIYGDQLTYVNGLFWEAVGAVPDWFSMPGGFIQGNEGETLNVSIELHYHDYNGMETGVGAIFDMVIGHPFTAVWPISLEYSQNPDTTPTGSGNSGTNRMVGDVTIPPPDASPDGWPIAYKLRPMDVPMDESVFVYAGATLRARFNDPYTL